MNIQKIKTYAANHKIISALIIIALLGSAYGIYKWKTGDVTITKYVIAAVEKGTVVTSISGSGQVSASGQIDISSKASGDISSVNVTTGQHVKSGEVIAQIDTSDALLDLQNAQITYQKAVASGGQTNIDQAEETLSKSYEDAFTSIAGAFIDFPDVITGLKDLYYASDGYLNDQSVQTLSETTKEKRTAAGINFDAAKKKYDIATLAYQGTSRTSPTASIETLIDLTYDAVKSTSDALKDAKNTVQYIKDQQSGSKQSQSDADEVLSDIATWSNKMSSDLSSLLSARNSIKQNKTSLSELVTTTPLDLQSAQIALQQKQNTYNDYFIRAPFDGIIAKVNVTAVDSVSNGTAIATLITDKQVAEITLNEVDIAKVKVGNKATLTFDAIENLSISGTVTSVDLVGSVSSGVVSYGVKIAFDTQDERVKSGMSVTASIVTDIQQNVLVIANNGLKSGSNGTYYVEIPGAEAAVTDSSGMELTGELTQTTVEIGASDDTSTEITSGLNEGDLIVIKKVTSSTAAKSSTSLLSGLFGGNRNGNTRTNSSSSSNKTTSSNTAMPAQPTGGNAGGPPAGF